MAAQDGGQHETKYRDAHHAPECGESEGDSQQQENYCEDSRVPAVDQPRHGDGAEANQSKGASEAEREPQRRHA
jgi:hypothetical protein